VKAFPLLRWSSTSTLADHRLGDAEPPNHGCRIAGFAHGGVATQAIEPGADPLGSGLAVHQHGLGFIPQRIHRRVYHSRDEARQDVFDYIELLYNPKRKHVRNGMLSPAEFEKQQKI
jgi:transposase InsO family protein